MNYINGTDSIFYIKVDELYYPVGCLTDTSFSESVETIDTTVRTNKNGWGSSRPVKQSYNIELSGLVTKESIVGGIVTFYNIQTLKRDRQSFDWKIEGGLEVVEYGTGYFTSLSRPFPIDDFISFSASIEGQGEPRVNPNIEGALDNELNMEL